MSTESPTPENKPAEPAEAKKSSLLWITAVVVILLIAGIFFFIRRSKADNLTPAPDTKQQPLFHRDEPTEKQIFQDDYRAKVREMLDSGKTVMEISKETKIRIDEVRKIKKEYKQSKISQ